MKNYLKQLEQNGITQVMVDQLAQALAQRAAQLGKPHPLGVYHALATDMALGAVETCADSKQELGQTHTAKQWLEIITNTELD